jgi:hypothetical protein
MRRAAFALGILLASAVAIPARAADGADQAAATELFNAGRDAMRRGDYAAACPKLAESIRLVATVGGLAKLAECEEHEGRLASAYGRWQQAFNLARSMGDPRTPDVQRELARLDARVAKLRVVSQAPLPPDAAIHVDATAFGPAGVGVPLPVGPGRHKVEVSAPGRATWTTTVDTAADGATTEVSVPPLALALAPIAPSVAPRPVPVVVSTTVPAAHSSGSGARILGLVSLGVGVAGIAAGTAVGLQAIHQRNEAGCTGTVCPSSGAAETLRSAQSTANWSTVLFAAGGALAATGLVVFWVARDSRTSTGLMLTPAGAFGRF